MKLVYIHQYFKTPDENGGTRSFDLARAFVKRGVEVNVVTTTGKEIGFDGRKWKIVELDGIRVHYLYLPYDNTFSFYRRVLVFIRFLLYSSLRVIKLDADVVLATSTPLTVGIPALIKKFFHKVPYIFEVRDVWPEAVIAIGAIKSRVLKKLLTWLEYILYKYASYIVPLSDDMRKSIVNRYPIFLDRTSIVVENIAELKRFETEDSPTNGFLKSRIGFQPATSILYAGTFGQVNNIDFVIDLASKLTSIDSSIIFLLVGDGSEKRRLIEKAESLRVLGRNVFFLDPVSKKDLVYLYSNVTMGSSFVAPIKALWSNSANKFFDTLAAGKPILINHGGWQADVIRENEIGYVLKPTVSDNDLLKLVAYLKNHELLEQAGKNGRRLAESKYSLAEAERKYWELLKTFQL